jgi:hypothetical protein
MQNFSGENGKKAWKLQVTADVSVVAPTGHTPVKT